MPRQFEFYRGTNPVDAGPIQSDVVRTAGSGIRAAGLALRESLGYIADMREARRERQKQREYESFRQDVAHTRDMERETRADLREQRRDVLRNDFQAAENEKTRANSLELEVLRQSGDLAVQQSRNEYQRTQDLTKARHDADKLSAKNLANAALTTVLNERSGLPFVRHVKLNLGQIFEPGKSDDQVMESLMGANAAARPYLKPEDVQAIGEAAKLYTKDQRATIFDPGSQGENYRALSTHVINQVNRELRGGELTMGHLEGIEEAINDRLGGLSANEHDAATKLRDDTFKKVQSFFGSTAAPAAQQTQSLDKLGMEGGQPGAPQPVTIAPSDLSDDFYVRLGGSPANGARLKELLTGADPKTGKAAQFVPVPQPDGSITIAIEGSPLSTQDRVAIERALNQPGPMREQLQGLMSLGPGDATSAERKQAGAGVRGASGTAPPASAGSSEGARAGAGPAPAAPKAPPQPTTPPAGGGALDQFRDIFNFINGQPKR